MGGIQAFIHAVIKTRMVIMQWIKKTWIVTYKLLKWGVVGVVALVIFFIAVVAWQLRFSDDSLLEKTAILSKMEEETSIYYLDGKERIGSVFSGVHRQYVPIRDVPAHMRNAIIAAEDKHFYLHRGVDFGAILMAFYEGIMNGGKFRRGGSTLTQQTVKNIMGDWEASFSRKFREMIKAMQLERLYDKDQILEFYLNQFHVAGNGNGIGIAANYYFNKNVLDLNLIEAAFIAGSVKSPSRYNPFMKRDRAGLDRARELAHARKNYVLRRMYEQGWISEDEYVSARQKTVVFEKGRFTTSDVALVELIQNELSRKEVLETTGLGHLSELKTAGLKVYTTIDKDLQQLAQRMTRRNLSRIQTILTEDVSGDAQQFKPLKSLKEGQFVFGKVVEIITGDHPEIKLSFGLPTGVLNHESLVRAAKLLDLPVGHKGGYRQVLRDMLTGIQVDDVLFVEVKHYNRKTFVAQVELYKYPEVSGGVVVLDKGEVRAVVSGFDTLGFNRAIYGKRQPGSVFKIPTLLAALQLGWNMLDPLYNNRQIFSYQGQAYFPRPDHQVRYPRPSLIWSGIMSENLAFVHLVSHLLDKLTFDQFKQLLDDLYLFPKPRESPRMYRQRVTQKLGVSLDDQGLKQHFLKQAAVMMEPDFIFSRDLKQADLIRTLWWGDGYEQEIQKLYREDLNQYSSAEIKKRMSLVRNNYQRYQKLHESLTRDLMLLEYAFEQHGVHNAFYLEDLAEIIPRFGVLETQSGKRLIYHRLFAGESYDAEDNLEYEQLFREEIATDYDKEMKIANPEDDQQDVVDDDHNELEDDRESNDSWSEGTRLVDFEDLNDDTRREFEISTRLYEAMAGWPVVAFYSLETADWEDMDRVRGLTMSDLNDLWNKNLLDPQTILLDGRMPLSHLHAFEEHINSEFTAFSGKPEDPYGLMRSYLHHDFRIALGLYYIKRLCRILGVYSYINPVMSLPLGTNVVTTADIARMFQTISTGKIYRFFEDGPDNQMAFIRRIEDRYGKVLYEAQPESRSVIDPIVLSQLTDIMRKIVTHGTGRRANRELYIDLMDHQSSSSRTKIRIPAYGKTGSTNDFTTSYFAGLVPYPKEGSDELTLDHIYTMASYVGYDIPRVMKNGRISIYGGSGALPLWTDFFRQLIGLKDYRSYLDAYDLDLITQKEWSVSLDEDLWESLRVDLPRGLVLGPISEKYVEDYKLTNLSETGEEYMNEFLNVRSVIGTVLAPSPLDLANPIPRVFTPLTSKTLRQKPPVSSHPSQ